MTNVFPITLGIVLTAAVLLLFMVVMGGLVVVVSLAALAVTLIVLPALWLTKKPRQAAKLVTMWGIYLAMYMVNSTGIVLVRSKLERPVAVGQEVCADSGCFAVDRVERSAALPNASYTLYWHLSSNDKQITKHFPGKGLELYLFDESGRKFPLPDTAERDPLDVTLPFGETVRQSMTFSVPVDAQQLFLTAQYRPFTFQSLLPGELSFLPRKPAQMIRIQ